MTRFYLRAKGRPHICAQRPRGQPEPLGPDGPPKLFGPGPEFGPGWPRPVGGGPNCPCPSPQPGIGGNSGIGGKRQSFSWPPNGPLLPFAPIGPIPGPDMPPLALMAPLRALFG